MAFSLSFSLGRQEIGELSLFDLYGRWRCVVRDWTKEAKRKDTTGFDRTHTELKECLSEIERRYRAVTSPVLNMLLRGEVADQRRVEADFIHGLKGGLLALAEGSEPSERYHQGVWAAIEREFQRAIERWGLTPVADFRVLKPKFMTRLFVDELPRPERNTMRICFYSSANATVELAAAGDDERVALIRKGLEALHSTFLSYRSRLEELTDRAIPLAMVQEVNRTKRYERYIVELQLASEG